MSPATVHIEAVDIDNSLVARKIGYKSRPRVWCPTMLSPSFAVLAQGGLLSRAFARPRQNCSSRVSIGVWAGQGQDGRLAQVFHKPEDILQSISVY